MVYREPESAYAVLDFSGIGTIRMDSILENLVVKRLKFSPEDIKLWLLRDKVFNDVQEEIGFDTFKKAFFPHLC